MSRTLPTVNWFELEVLTSVSEKPKYGQQLLKELSILLSEQVSSGRLYPVLQKLEKHDYVAKSEQERGRFFYSLTRKGEEEIARATQWSLRSLMEALTKKFIIDVSLKLQQHLESDVEEGKTEGREIRKIATIKIPPPEVFRQMRYHPMERFIEDIPDIELFSIFINTGKSFERFMNNLPESDSSPNITDMVGEFDDLLLKDEYVDIVFLSDSCLLAPDKERHMEEVTRILKVGGKLYFTVIAKYDSYIFESLADIIHASEGSQLRPRTGMKEEEVRVFLERHLVDVKIERIKELFLASGKKKGDT